MKINSKELNVICLSHLMPNINNTHNYYLSSFTVAAKRKIMVIDEIYYLMWADRELKAERTYFNAARAAIDNCSIRINLNKRT
ncbi:hypothetical protein KDV38_19830 [Providencia rettgeri]